MTRPNLAQELAKHLDLKGRLLAAFPELRDDPDALLDTLDGATDLRVQIEAILNSAEEDRMMAAALQGRLADMEARLKRFDARQDRKREIVALAMAEAGLKKIELDIATVSLVNGRQSVIVTDETAIPPAYLRQPPPVPDKKLIGAALREGPVPGCQLTNAPPHLQIRRT